LFTQTPQPLGEDIFSLSARLFPICRSITGRGVRETLRLLQAIVPLQIHEIPTGTQVFDWVIPKEWNIRDAYIKDCTGQRIVDFQKSNLHVVSYSVPVSASMPLSALKPHLHSLPDLPNAIPYRTSYYERQWGFCLSHHQLESLRDDCYDVVIDSTLEDGSLTYGEFLHPGASQEEFLLSAHTCHPSLANDNCSGLALLAILAGAVSKMKTHYTYRFLFAPGTIGAITWLWRNRERVQDIKHGLVVSCVGDAGGPTYKRSRIGDAEIDRVMAHIVGRAEPSSKVIDFFPHGYDERQYCSPGFNLPVGSFCRSQYGTFPEYHTSADNLDLITPAYLASSYKIIAEAIAIIEKNVGGILSRQQNCEPQLGKWGVYDLLRQDGVNTDLMTVLWVLNLADGTKSLLDIAERSNTPFFKVSNAFEILKAKGLVVESPLPNSHSLNCPLTR
jgi:aminopeptidase-like protein